MKQEEIARLVFGWLQEECLDAAAIFGATSSHLLDYRIQTFRQENPTTKVLDTTLDKILQEYKKVFAWIKNKFFEIKGLKSEFNPKNLLQHLQEVIKAVNGNDPDQSDVTAVYDSRAYNTKTEENKKAEDEKADEAQLILGYLESECSDAAACFAATSSHLAQYRLQIFQKKSSTTTLNGLNLVDILQQYCAILAYIQNEIKEMLGSPTVCNPGDFIKNLEIILHKLGVKTASNRKRRGRRSNKDIIKGEQVALTLTKKQESVLNELYKVSDYVRGPRRVLLAKELRMSEMQIQQWFQRKRNESRRIPIRSSGNSADSSATTSDTLPGPSSSQTGFLPSMNNINSCPASSSTQHEGLVKSEDFRRELIRRFTPI